MTSEQNVHEVDPARLESGRWCHRAQKKLGEGDISRSYSADRIGMDKPVRKPFSWQGALMVCVGKSHLHGVTTAKAYRLVHPQIFDGEIVTYGERVRNADEARADGCGFYHGMSVRHAGQTMVLCGPALTFVPGQTEQPDLFGDAPQNAPDGCEAVRAEQAESAAQMIAIQAR